MRRLVLVVGVLLLILFALRPWGDRRLLLVVVSDVRTCIDVLPRNVTTEWDPSNGLLWLGDPRDQPRGDEVVFVVYLLRGAGMPLRSEVQRIRRLPHPVSLAPGFPGAPHLNLLAVDEDGSLRVEWSEDTFSVAPGSQWSEICMETGDGERAILPGEAGEIREAVASRSNMARLTLFNAGWRTPEDVGDER